MKNKNRQRGIVVFGGAVWLVLAALVGPLVYLDISAKAPATNTLAATESAPEVRLDTPSLAALPAAATERLPDR